MNEQETERFKADIPTQTAQAAYSGTSWNPENRAQTERDDYAATLAEDYAMLAAQADKGGTRDKLEAEFARYRAGYRKRMLAHLHSSARCVSWFIAGPSNFPAARMNKRADIASRRLNDLIEFRARALAAIKRTLRPDLAPIYASDENALERLEAKIHSAEVLQGRMKLANATIRKHAKAGAQSQVAALLELGYSLSQAQKLLEPDFCDRIGFPDYLLTNNNANIRRMKARVETIAVNKAAAPIEAEGENARFEDCPADNRVRLFFLGKPPVEVRTRLKQCGFRWSPTIGAWQAYRHLHTIEAAKREAGLNAELAIQN